MKSPFLFACSVLLTAAVACGQNAPKEETVVPVSVIRVKGMQSSYTRSYIGTVVSKHTTVLVSPYGGTVVDVPVHLGQKVSSGTLVVEVDSPTAKNMKKTADATLSQARDGYQRAEKVYKAGGMSEIQWKDISTKLVQAEATAEMANNMVDECHVTAPWDAVISELHVVAGDEVKPMSRLATVIDENNLEVSIGVPENEFSRIREGMEAEVVIPALDYLSSTAKVHEIGVMASLISHSYNVRLVFNQQPKGLKAGMACKVNLQTDQQRRLIVPASVVKVDDNGRYVWVVNSENRVEKRAVTAGSFAGTGVSIENGINVGDRIIVEGSQKVSTGMRVQPDVVKVL